MTVEELISKLQAMPPHYEVDCYHESVDRAKVALVLEVERYSLQKTVSLLITCPQ